MIPFNQTLDDIMQHMRGQGLSEITINKYLHDINHFLLYVGDQQMISKTLTTKYRHDLIEKYKITSANSMIASVNYYLKYESLDTCCMSYFKTQKAAFRNSKKELSREEYLNLLQKASDEKQRRLYMIMLTLGMTGIRIGELKYITLDAVEAEQAIISMKRKTRTILIPELLAQELKKYANEKDIKSGRIFITRHGKDLDRSNILHDMKKLAEKCNINQEKVHPHSFRHLFAVTYYEKEKDICHLADILGHSDLNTTRIYTLVSAEEQKKKIDQLQLFYSYQK